MSELRKGGDEQNIFALATIGDLRQAAIVQGAATTSTLAQTTADLRKAAAPAFRNPTRANNEAAFLLEKQAANLIKQQQELEQALRNTPKHIVYVLDLTGSMDDDERDHAQKVLSTAQVIFGQQMMSAIGIGDEDYDHPFWVELNPRDKNATKTKMGGGGNDHESPIQALYEYLLQKELIGTAQQEPGRIDVYIVTDEHSAGKWPDFIPLDKKTRAEFERNAGSGKGAKSDLGKILKELKKHNVVIHAITPEKNLDGHYNLICLAIAWQYTGGDWTELGKDVQYDTVASPGVVPGKDIGDVLMNATRTNASDAAGKLGQVLALSTSSALTSGAGTNGVIYA